MEANLSTKARITTHALPDVLILSQITVAYDELLMVVVAARKGFSGIPVTETLLIDRFPVGEDPILALNTAVDLILRVNCQCHGIVVAMPTPSVTLDEIALNSRSPSYAKSVFVSRTDAWKGINAFWTVFEAVEARFKKSRSEMPKVIAVDAVTAGAFGEVTVEVTRGRSCDVTVQHVKVGQSSDISAPCSVRNPYPPGWGAHAYNLEPLCRQLNIFMEGVSTCAIHDWCFDGLTNVDAVHSICRAAGQSYGHILDVPLLDPAWDRVSEVIALMLVITYVRFMPDAFRLTGAVISGGGAVHHSNMLERIRAYFGDISTCLEIDGLPVSNFAPPSNQLIKGRSIRRPIGLGSLLLLYDNITKR